MNNVHKILILSLFVFFTSSGTSRAAQGINLTWMSLMLGNTSSCDATHLDLCSTESTCTGAGGYWYNDTCNVAADAAYGTVTTAAGQVWMDRNLGASQVAESSTDSEAYGDLYQWGRGTDGHEKRSNLTTTSTLSVSDTPINGDFIITSSTPFDWKVDQNDELWQGLAGTNNPCPSGFRLPTQTDFEAETVAGAADAFASPMKLTMAGSRHYVDGGIDGADTSGVYWSSTVNAAMRKSFYLNFGPGYSGIYSHTRAYGYSVRCIQD